MADQVLPGLLQLGIAAPFVAGMWWAYLREVKRSDRLETENTRLHTVNEEKTIPTLAASGAALKEVADMMNDSRMQGEIDRRVTNAIKSYKEAE